MVLVVNHNKGNTKVNCKVHPRTDHGSPEREQRYNSSTLSSRQTVGGEGGGVINATFLPLYPQEKDPAPIL
jgi:hypothetical protein